MAAGAGELGRIETRAVGEPLGVVPDGFDGFIVQVAGVELRRHDRATADTSVVGDGDRADPCLAASPQRRNVHATPHAKLVLGEIADGVAGVDERWLAVAAGVGDECHERLQARRRDDERFGDFQRAADGNDQLDLPTFHPDGGEGFA